MATHLFARISDGVVAEVWPHDAGAALPEGITTPVQAFGEAFGSTFVACGLEVAQGWTYDGVAFAAPVAVVPPVPPRQVEVSTLLDALSTSKRAAIGQDNRDRLIARGAKGPVEIADPKVVRAAADVAKLVPGFTPEGWFDLALAPAA